MDYGVEDILDGKWSAVTLQKIRNAALDEHLSIVSLLNGRLCELFRKCSETELFVTKLYEYMKLYKENMEQMTAEEIYRKADADREGLRKAELLTRKEEQTWKRVLEFWNRAVLDIKGKLLTGEPAFEHSKALFEEEVETLDAVTEQTKCVLQNVFDFLEAAFGESQEMIFFITELNANTYSMWFIRENGSDSYYRYNKGILFEQRQKAILGEMDALENSLERGIY